MALVFQYGSNTSTARLNSRERLNGRARSLGLVRTVDRFELGFTVWSRTNGCAAADLIPDGARAIWGVLYEIPDRFVFRDLCPAGERCLDQIEHEGQNYVREALRLVRPDGRRIGEPVHTYFALERRYGLRTSERYAGHILTGLREHGAPSDYMEYVQARVAEHLPLAPAGGGGAGPGRGG